MILNEQQNSSVEVHSICIKQLTYTTRVCLLDKEQLYIQPKNSEPFKQSSRRYVVLHELWQKWNIVNEKYLITKAKLDSFY